MKPIRYFWLFLTICLFAVAGWQSTSSAVVIGFGSTGYELGGDYTEWERDQACTSITPFDGRAAYERHRSDSNLILWTFLVNFNLLSHETGNPIGCLRLYHREEPGVDRAAGTYEEIDSGGILIDTCTPGVAGSVRFDEEVASFDETGYVQCAMDVLTWVEMVSGDARLPGILTDEIPDALRGFFDHNPHHYESFTMVASLSSIEPTGVSDVPIMYYDAPAVRWWVFDFDYYDQAMQIRVVPTNHGSGITFPHDACATSDSILPMNDTSVIWWYDFEQPGRKYQYQRVEERSECGRLPPPTFSPPLFWVGPAILYIGNTPTAGGFKGSLDGVLVDPTDSRPPKRR